MKPALVVFFFLMMILRIEAQETIALPAAAAEKDTVKNQRSKAARTRISKPEYHISVGMDFSTSSGYGSGFTQYVVPTVSIPLGKRFMVSGGIAVANTNYFNARPLFSGDAFQPYSGNYTSLTVFASGTYFVNDRLTISGAFYKEIPIAGKPLSYSPYNTATGQGSQGFRVNAKYKLGEHVFIQAGFEMNQGRDPYNLSRYRIPGFEPVIFQ